jgi:uncharacterized protein YegJ (DUF2314 family)
MHAPAPTTLQAVPPEMPAAIEQARKTIQQFFDAFDAPRPNQSNFLLRVRFTAQAQSGESAAEHLWLTQLDFSTNPPTGVIATQPYLPGLNRLQRVPFQSHQVSDWMYVEDGRPVGAYTTRLLRGDPPQPTSRFTLLRDLWML